MRVFNFNWTVRPSSDIIIGLTYSPDIELQDAETDDITQACLLSLGLLFFRIDIIF